MPILLLSGGLWLLISAPLLLMAYATRVRVEERCSSCRHLLGRPHPTRCAECGADLSAPAAITSAESRFELRYFAIALVTLALPPIGLVGFVSFSIFGGYGLLPNSVLVPLAAGNGVAALSARDALSSRYRSPEQAVELAELLIRHGKDELASRREPGPPLTLGHIPAAVIAGTLGRDAIARALEASATADISVETGGGGARVLRFAPRFSSDLFDPFGRAAIVLESVRFDGGDAVGARTEPQFRDATAAFVVAIPSGAVRADWRLRLIYLERPATLAATFGPNGELTTLDGATGEVTVQGSLDLAP